VEKALMKHVELRDLDVSRIGLGAMGMSFGYTGAGSDDAESIRTIHRALELGVTFLDTTPAQVAIAWLLSKGDDIAPIPGTKRVSRVEENAAADGLELTAEQVAELDSLTPPAGDHHDEAQMQMIGR
jgi:aryl-alcohol dehydrogenase-like predicted oxidoreductase